MILASNALKHPKEAILKACDMAFDMVENGTATIARILARADRIVPGHFPELVRQPNGAFCWTDASAFDLRVR